MLKLAIWGGNDDPDSVVLIIYFDDDYKYRVSITAHGG